MLPAEGYSVVRALSGVGIGFFDTGSGDLSALPRVILEPDQKGINVKDVHLEVSFLRDFTRSEIRSRVWSIRFGCRDSTRLNQITFDYLTFASNLQSTGFFIGGRSGA